MTGGAFVTFEGIDGAGKSTHIEPAAAWSRARGHVATTTREPGGSALGERIRDLVLGSTMDGVTETLLVFAARRDHLETAIRPALGRGEWVLCDRYTDATFAYQGGGRGVSRAWLGALEHEVQRGLQPDLTLWFDLDPAVAARRRAAARAADRFEAEDVAFFERVREGYEQRRLADQGRVVRIDASADRETVWRGVEAALVVLSERMTRSGPGR